MQIHLERSGGFAGLRLIHDIDSTALSPEQQAELNNLIEQSHLFELPPVLRAEHAGADRFQYKLRVRGDSHEQSVELDEDGMSTDVATLCNDVEAPYRRG